MSCVLAIWRRITCGRGVPTTQTAMHALRTACGYAVASETLTMTVDLRARDGLTGIDRHRWGLRRARREEAAALAVWVGERWGGGWQ